MAGKWALLIGTDQYHESLGPLKYAGADCRLLRDTLVNGLLGFPEDQVLLLDDTQDAEHRPTFANIHSVLGSWLAAPGEDDLVLVFFAGHGRLVDGSTYLAPGDATLASIHTLGIPLRHVQDVMERCKARRKLLVVDACHSGAGRDVAVMSACMQEALAGGSGFYTIASCGPEELSHEWVEKGQGVFTHFLAEALWGGCSPAADGKLTLDRVYEWVHDHVAKWAALHRCSQTPQRFARGAGDIILAEGAPDYAALAEQYRKELDAAKARLAEVELHDIHERIAKKETEDKKTKKKSKVEDITISPFLDALTKKLDSCNPELRREAIKTIGDIGDEAFEVMPRVALFLSDEYASVRRVAGTVLLPYLDERCMDGIIKAAHSSNPDIRKFICEIIGECGPQAAFAIRIISNLLNDDYGSVRVMAEWAAKRMMNKPVDNKPSSGCFISTASGIALGWADEGPELNSLRLLRDTFMQETEERRAEVAEYYRIAPAIVKRINQESDALTIWREVADTHVKPIVLLAREGEILEAYLKYKIMVCELFLKWFPIYTAV